jgi:hypothetical protein
MKKMENQLFNDSIRKMLCKDKKKVIIHKI